MSEAPFDAEAYKAAARRGWTRVADGWRRWWRTFEEAAQPLNERLVELAGIGAGMRVLDVATGLGEPALTAARKVGPEGRVLATDLSPRMVELGRERAAELGLLQTTFAEADAERLVLEPASFDAALSRWGLMLMAEPAAALAGIRAALVPGGRLACAVWSTPERAPFLALGREAAARELGLAPPHPDAPGPFRLAEERALVGLVERAGFTVEKEERFPVRFGFASAEAYADFVFELSSALGGALAEASPEARGRAREAVLREARPRVEPAAASGGAAPLVLVNETVCVVARR